VAGAVAASACGPRCRFGACPDQGLNVQRTAEQVAVEQIGPALGQELAFSFNL
jgi:hypothetical protein